MAIPTKVFGLAAAVAFALLILILGCIFEEKWWSLFTAVCYLVAGTSWLLFQPGIWLAASRAVGWHNSTRGSLHNSAQVWLCRLHLCDRSIFRPVRQWHLR